MNLDKHLRSIHFTDLYDVIETHRILNKLEVEFDLPTLFRIKGTIEDFLDDTFSELPIFPSLFGNTRLSRREIFRMTHISMDRLHATGRKLKESKIQMINNIGTHLIIEETHGSTGTN